MNRILAVSLIAVSTFAVTACEGQPPEYGQPGGPLIGKTDPSCQATSGSTIEKQQQSGYYSYAGCPDVPIPPSRR